LVLKPRRTLAALAKGGFVVVPEDTLPGNTVYFQPLGTDMHFTALRPFSLPPNFDGIKVNRTIRHELWFKNEGMKIHYYTLLEAGFVVTNNGIKKLISHSIELEGEHIIALL
jgi:hypothetical protein